ncbi:MAG: T9SS type A sorting domain-containing protein [Bacteroidia bacterium]
MKQPIHFLFMLLFLLPLHLLHAQQASFDVDINLPVGSQITQSVFLRNGGVVTASIFSTTILPDGIRFSRHDNEGEIVWTKIYITQRYSYLHLSDISQTQDGGFIAGFNSFLQSSPQSEALIVRFDSTCNVVWEKYIEAPDAPYYDVGAQVHVAESPDSSVYVVFNQNSDTSASVEYYTVLTHLTSAGNIIWTRVIDSNQAICLHINASATDRVHLFGYFGTTQLATFDSSGQFISSKGYSDPLGGLLAIRDWHIDSLGIVRALLFTSQSGTSLLVRLDTSGSIISSQMASGILAGTLRKVQNDYISTASRTSNSSNIFCNWQSSTNDPRGLLYQYVSNTLFISNFSSQPNSSLMFLTFDYSAQATVANRLVKTDMALSGIMPLSGCGLSADTITIQSIQINDVSDTLATIVKQNISLPSYSYYDADEFSITVNCKRVSVPDITTENTINLYPNPVSDWLIAEGNFANDAVIRFFNSAGQTLPLPEIERSGLFLRADMSSLPEGIYFLQTTTADGKTVTAKIVVVH